MNTRDLLIFLFALLFFMCVFLLWARDSNRTEYIEIGPITHDLPLGQ